MNRFLTRRLCRLMAGLLLAAPLMSGPVLAASEVHFHGTLMTGSCSASALDVDFGEITVDGVVETTTTDPSAAPAAAPSSLNITCTGGIAGTVQISLTGTPAAFNSQALTTNIADLGVQVTSAVSNSPSSVMVPGTWYTLKSGAGNYPLVALLVRNPGATLKGGDFLATGTIAVQIA